MIHFPSSTSRSRRTLSGYSVGVVCSWYQARRNWIVACVARDSAQTGVRDASALVNQGNPMLETGMESLTSLVGMQLDSRVRMLACGGFWSKPGGMPLPPPPRSERGGVHQYYATSKEKCKSYYYRRTRKYVSCVYGKR